MNKSFDETGAQFAWDSTSLKLAAECGRKYYYKMIEGWQPFHKSDHLIFGGHYATALEHWHKYLALGMDREDALRAIVREALEATWLRDAEGVGRPWQSFDNNKTRETLIRTIIWYVDEFIEDNLVTYQTEKGPAVEFSFSLNVDDGYVLCGHIDRLVTYGDDIMVTDNKTTGSTITPRYFKQYDLDLQMSMYTFAGKTIYSLPVKGVVIDAAQIAVDFSRFERGFTWRTEAQLNEWYDTTMAYIENARRMTHEQNFPMNLTACGNYGGCEFRHVCGADPQVRDQFLKSDFFKGPTWDPLERR